MKHQSALTVFICHADRVGLWPDGKIPDFQSHQIVVTNKEVNAQHISTSKILKFRYYDLVESQKSCFIL